MTAVHFNGGANIVIQDLLDLLFGFRTGEFYRFFFSFGDFQLRLHRPFNEFLENGDELVPFRAPGFGDSYEVACKEYSVYEREVVYFFCERGAFGTCTTREINDRTRVVSGKSVSVRITLGGCCSI